MEGGGQNNPLEINNDFSMDWFSISSEGFNFSKVEILTHLSSLLESDHIDHYPHNKLSKPKSLDA